jgi:streptogramin lyase
MDWSSGSGISTTSRPWGIVAGPDGNLWYAAERNGKIGRMSPTTLTATEFPTGSPTSGPRGIAVGPDGNLWFAEYNRDTIGRITTAGAVTEFSTGITPGSRPHNIAAGPDGNLWFTEYDAHRVGRVRLDGSISEFSVGISPSSLVGITGGPDGNVWFAEAADKIGRINPEGIVTEFASGITAGASPYDITAGPDGNLWFTELGKAGIGRITPAGAVTEFRQGITSGTEPKQIRTGPDGNLWFTEGVGNRIARLNIELPPSASTGGPTAIASTAVTVSGAVTPLGAQASYLFQYGRTIAYGTATTSRILPAGAKPVEVSATIGGLRPSTLYHYRLVATNAFGTVNGPDRTFTTLRAGEGGTIGGATTDTDRTGPTMRVAGRALRLVRGRLRVRLGCPLAETLGCRGTVTLRARRLKLGSASFRIGGGQTKTVSIRVSRRAAARVRRGHRLRATLTVIGIDASGNRKTTTRRLTVRG